jgi:parallel beta helix pectate lyase-like protein
MRIAIAVLAGAMALTLVTAGAPAKSHRVLRVGTFHGVAGNYKTIQSAVNAANPGDWILVAPGDYKEAVRIKKDDIHLRGLNRNSVIVDGTKSGKACSSKKGDQNLKRGDNGNGIEVFKADGVYIENLTACNFLGEGNQIWWNGGDGSGKIGMNSWYGSFLTATTTFFAPKKPQATYGIFVSNARGPGSVSDSYASNMNDASYYVGACNPCNATITRAHGQHSNLGYSGTNSAKVLIENSEFDDNTSGIVTNSQNNDDAPSPQLDSTFRNNFVHDNNNPNVPSEPESLRVVGSGIVVAGGRNNVISGNRIERNGAWGVLVVPFIDMGKPPKVAHCQGGTATKNGDGTTTCFFDDFNNEVAGNALLGNGSFGNPTNGDLADVSGQNALGNCWHDNVRADGSAVTAEPGDLQTAHAACGQPGQGDGITSELALQGLCDSQLLAKCKRDATHKYPRTTKITVRKLPKLKSMPNPCEGVPANPWCKS